MSMNLGKSRIMAIATLGLLTTTVGCDLFNNKEEPGSVSVSQSVLDSGQGTIGIKNLNQLAPAYSVALGVPMDANLTTVASNAIPWLSADGTIDNVNATMLLAITGLAGHFCKTFLAQEASLAPDKRKATKSVDFTKGTVGLTDAIVGQVLDRYAQIFWRRSPDSSEMSTLRDSLNEAAAAVVEPANGTDAQRSTAAQNALLVPCTAAATSIDFIKE